MAPARAQPLHLDAATLHDTAGHVQWLADPSGQWQASQAASAPGWQPLRGSLGAGYTDAAIWLKLQLQVPAVRPEGDQQVKADYRGWQYQRQSHHRTHRPA